MVPVLEKRHTEEGVDLGRMMIHPCKDLRPLVL